MLTIKINLEAMEAMMYFWQSTSERQKVNERFLTDLAAMPAFKHAYDEEFNAESVRKVLSAITNREPFKPANRKEGRFFNNNLWMLEDLSITREMLQPVKTLNLDGLAKKLSEQGMTGARTVYFAPLHLEDFYSNANELALNFFRVQPDFSGGVTFADVPLESYIAERIR